MTTPPNVNIAQRVLTGAQDFIPSGVRSLPWTLVPALFPTLDATSAVRRLFWSASRHTMAGVNLGFRALFDPTPIDVIRRYHMIYAALGSGGGVTAEIVLVGSAIIGNTYTTIFAERDSGNRHENMLMVGAGGGFAPTLPYVDIPAGGKLRLQSKGTLPQGRVVDFGFVYEELAAPVVSELKTIDALVTES